MFLLSRDAPVPVLTDIGSCFGTETDQNRLEPKPEPIGTETGTDQNRLEPKPEPIRTEIGTDQNRLEPKSEPIRTDWNRNRNLSEQVEVGTRNKLTQCTEKSEK